MPKKGTTSTSPKEKTDIIVYLTTRKLNDDLPPNPQTIPYYLKLLKEDLSITTNNAFVKAILDRLEIPWIYSNNAKPVQYDNMPEDLSLVPDRELIMLAHIKIKKLEEQLREHKNSYHKKIK